MGQTWINYYINWLAGFQPSTVGPKKHTHTIGNISTTYQATRFFSHSFIGHKQSHKKSHQNCQVVMFVCNISWTMQWRTLELGRRVRVSGNLPGGNRREWESGEEHRILTQVNSSFCSWSIYSNSFVDPMGWNGNMKVHRIYWSADLIMKTDPPEAPLSYPPFDPGQLCHIVSLAHLQSTAFTAANVISQHHVSTGDRCVFVLRSLPIWYIYIYVFCFNIAYW